MILKTKDFKEAINTILFAVGVDKNAGNLELSVKDNFLYLNVTNKEYYVSRKFPVEGIEPVRAVVDATQFLNLVSGIADDEFELDITDRVTVKIGKSKYDLAMIYDNEELMKLTPIFIRNKTVEMTVSNDILMSIMNVNSKEVQKVKNLNVNELQKLYYIDEHGCFTFTRSACLNTFELEKPIKLLLNDRIVKLFKLFNTDVHLAYGNDALSDGITQAKVVFQNESTYLAAIITNDDLLLSKVQGPFNSTKQLIELSYANHLVLSSNTLAAAISRLMLFTKNSIKDTNMLSLPMKVNLKGTDMTIIDSQDNSETVTCENDSYIDDEYEMTINIADLKAVLDSCKDEYITLNCGNHRSVVINHGKVYNALPEYKPAQVQ